MVNETVRKIPIRSRKKVLDKRKSLSTRKKKKLRRKLLSTRPREEISIGNVGLATTKLLGKKTFKKSKKKPLGTLEETIAGESKEDFWKSHVELDEDREDSEEGFYSPSKRDEEDDPNIFYGPSNNESKYEAGQDSIDSRPSSNVEVIRPGLALKSSEKDSFDPSGNFIQGSKKRKTSSQGVVGETSENPLDRLYSGARKDFDSEKHMANPEKLHDYDSAKKYK